MDHNKQILAVGLLFGIVITLLFCLVFAPRYVLQPSAEGPVKLDRWSGETWRYAAGNWAKIQKTEQDWKEVDNALSGALNLQEQNGREQSHTSDLLQALKNKYPVLAGVPNEDLIQRINIVYSKAILTDMYLKNIEKIHAAEVPK